MVIFGTLFCVAPALWDVVQQQAVLTWPAIGSASREIARETVSEGVVETFWTVLSGVEMVTA